MIRVYIIIEFGVLWPTYWFTLRPYKRSGDSEEIRPHTVNISAK